MKGFFYLKINEEVKFSGLWISVISFSLAMVF